MERISTRKTGEADLPLHYGKAPHWLFQRMAALCTNILDLMLCEFPPETILKRLSDPFWFQSLGCLLGFDWHSSGLTTTVCGALKQASTSIGEEGGLFIAGGKGGRSRKTLEEIISICEGIGLDPNPLIYASRMCAKVDNACVQDGFTIYHHILIFTKKGGWCVIQQGMNEELRKARRYHWFGEGLASFVEEPHRGVVCDVKAQTLNLVARESKDTRDISYEIATGNPIKTYYLVARVFEEKDRLILPDRHWIKLSDIDLAKLKSILFKIHSSSPSSYEDLVGLEGVGAKTLRALALVSDLVYGKPPSYKDVVTFSFAHGGKDRHPYPVDLETYERTIEVIEKAIKSAKIGYGEKIQALKRLSFAFVRNHSATVL
ncbi:MAG: DUF763 domain-containing protein [bacterium]